MHLKFEKCKNDPKKSAIKTSKKGQLIAEFYADSKCADTGLKIFRKKVRGKNYENFELS
jgi:hypothetical protein